MFGRLGLPMKVWCQPMNFCHTESILSNGSFWKNLTLSGTDGFTDPSSMEFPSVFLWSGWCGQAYNLLIFRTSISENDSRWPILPAPGWNMLQSQTLIWGLLSQRLVAVLHRMQPKCSMLSTSCPDLHAFHKSKGINYLWGWGIWINKGILHIL